MIGEWILNSVVLFAAGYERRSDIGEVDLAQD